MLPVSLVFLSAKKQKSINQKIFAKKNKMILEIILVVVMLVAAISAGTFKNLLNAVIAAGFVSFIAAILFFLLHAPDVAMAEASIGAALTVAIFVIALKKTKRHEDDEKNN